MNMRGRGGGGRWWGSNEHFHGHSPDRGVGRVSCGVQSVNRMGNDWVDMPTRANCQEEPSPWTSFTHCHISCCHCWISRGGGEGILIFDSEW